MYLAATAPTKSKGRQSIANPDRRGSRFNHQAMSRRSTIMQRSQTRGSLRRAALFDKAATMDLVELRELPPPPPMLVMPEYFEVEMELFQELASQLTEVERTADHYRDAIEHLIQELIAVKRTLAMLPAASRHEREKREQASAQQVGTVRQQRQAWGQQSQAAPDVTEEDELQGALAQAVQHIQQKVLPQLFQAAHLQEDAEHAGRRAPHLARRLRASQHVMAAYAEREAFVQAFEAELGDEEWEDAQHLLSTVTQVMMPHLPALEAIPEERRTPSEAMAIRILSAASGHSE